MTAVITGAALSPAAIITAAHDIYRHSQWKPFSPALFTAQSQLWHLLEPHTRTDDRNPAPGPDLREITALALALGIATDYAAEYVSNGGNE